MPRLSKRKKEFEKLVDKKKTYPLKEAISILKKAPQTKFDSSIDLAFNLNTDPKQSTQMVRGTVALPHGTGKSIKVACFCKGKASESAKEAGADFIGSDELIAKVKTGWCDFDIAVATPDMMKEIASLGKILGPRGLMPNPKAGTVTQDVANAIKEVKKGKVEFKMNKQSDINISCGRLSFSDEKVYQNCLSLIKAVQHSRPASIKGQFIKGISISSTMGPGLKLNMGELK